MLPLPTILVALAVTGSAGSGWSLTRPGRWRPLGAALRVLSTALSLVLAWVIHALPLALAALTLTLLIGVFVRHRSRAPSSTTTTTSTTSPSSEPRGGGRESAASTEPDGG
ncbi:MAG: hypothetical protein R3B09_01985 [Nannocystaceae bacterium]